MNATAIIAEDESLLAQALHDELARQWPDLQVLELVTHGEAAVEQTLLLNPDVCFFDIQMPGMSGLEAAQALAEDWAGDRPFPLLVFVTAYDKYALEAFDAAAVDYVLKPVEPARLGQTCARLQALLSQRQDAGQALLTLEQTVAQLQALLQPAPHEGRSSSPLTVIQASVGNAIQLVPVAEVLYFEAADKYVRVVTAQREYLIRTSLRELLPQLDEQDFWQIHRSVVVRVAAIESAARDETGRLRLSLRGGRPERLTVSRLYAHLFRAM
jgi:DNA-binding LytR/AlgR family response regulator